MDLRPYGLSAELCDVAAQVLNYQPFIISDDLQTGAGYSQLYHEDPRSAPPLVFRRGEWQAKWDSVSEGTGRQRAMYDRFLRAIADRYPGGTLFDAACNNGYFPVRAEMFGMGPSAGMDTGAQYAASIGFLNMVCGTHASFVHATYNPMTHSAPVSRRFDVVVATAILCHLPDPAYFLAYLGSLAKEAIFLWEQLIDTEEILITYRPPHPSLVHHETPGSASFPHFFNECTAVSRGFLELALKSMGFKNLTYLSGEWTPVYAEPQEVPPDTPEAARHAVSVLDQIRGRMRQHVAVLATR